MKLTARADNKFGMSALSWRWIHASAATTWMEEKEEEERSLSIDLKRHARLAVAWSRHGSLVPRWN